MVVVYFYVCPPVCPGHRPCMTRLLSYEYMKSYYSGENLGETNKFFHRSISNFLYYKSVVKFHSPYSPLPSRRSFSFFYNFLFIVEKNYVVNRTFAPFLAAVAVFMALKLSEKVCSQLLVARSKGALSTGEYLRFSRFQFSFLKNSNGRDRQRDRKLGRNSRAAIHLLTNRLRGSSTWPCSI